MALVQVVLGIEETEFIPAMRVLKGVRGVAKIDFDLDGLDGKKKKSNGTEALASPVIERAEPGEKPSIKQLLVMKLANGKAHRKVLIAALRQHGYEPKSFNKAMDGLRRDGITEGAGYGVHRLTAKAAAQMMSPPVETALLALPAPKSESAKRTRLDSPGMVIAEMQGRPGHVGLGQLYAALPKLTPRAVASTMNRLVKRGLVRRTNNIGEYELTAKGKKFQNPKKAKE